MRKIKLFFIRKTKATFLRWNLHGVFGFITGFLLNFAYLIKFSKWRKKHSKSPYNDFFSNKFDFNKRYNLYKFLLEEEKIADATINYWEFGVYTGSSFNWWLEHNKNENSKFVGFDTFDGLPENWNIYKKGDMTTSGNKPYFDDKRYELIEGLFQDTVKDFIKTFDFDINKRNIINLDADLYSSTIFVLYNLYPHLKKDDIIIFDEFGVPNHEFRAFLDFFNSTYLKYELLAASNNYYQIAIKII